MSTTGTARARTSERREPLTIKQSGRGYIVADSKGNEMLLTPVGNISADRQREFVDTLRTGVRAATTNK